MGILEKSREVWTEWYEGWNFSSNGDVEQNNGGAADWQEVMQGVKQGVRIHQLYRCFFDIIDNNYAPRLSWSGLV